MKDWQKQILRNYSKSKWLLDSRRKPSPWKVISFPYKSVNYSYSVTISFFPAQERHFQIINSQPESFIFLVLYKAHEKYRIEFLSKNKVY